LVVDELCLGMRKEEVLRRLLLLSEEEDQTYVMQFDLEEDPEIGQVEGVLCLEEGALDVSLVGDQEGGD